MKQNYRYIDQAKKIIKQEEGVTLKNWGGKLPVALVWPNSYRVGMSSLALHILYRLFNDEPDVVCERVFFGDQRAPDQMAWSTHSMGIFKSIKVSSTTGGENVTNGFRRSKVRTVSTFGAGLKNAS